jgi:hypothetical protein
MKTKSLVSLVSAVCTTLALAAENDPAARQLQGYPKNLARQHLGANLFIFNAATQTYVPTEAAAAWLDDDVTTGWPALAGKQHYLIALPEPELLSNFSISTRPSAGTVSIYAGDEPAAPGAKSWTALRKDVAMNAINEKKLAQPFSRFAKYVLVETDIADPGPLYSLYLYGERSAVDYNLRKREAAIDSTAIFGKYVNNKTAFNLNGLYAQGRVTGTNSQDSYIPLQQSIDDNPETGITLSGSTSEAGEVIAYGSTQSVSRISLLTEGAPKGKLEFFAITEAPGAPAEAAVTPASIPAPGSIPTAAKPLSLEGRTAFISMVLDGSTSRAAIDFPAVQASKLAVRWTPANGTDTLSIRELGSYGPLSLNEYEVGLKPEAVTAYGGSGKDYKSGKEIAEGPRDPKDPKGDPIALGPNGAPYLPGALGFPPNITTTALPVSP